MALLTSPRRRHLANFSKQATRQLISFQLRQEWCALPIDSVEKVVLMGTVYGDPNHTGVSVTAYEGRELVVVDVAYRIFGESQTAHNSVERNPNENSSAATQAARFLLIVRDETGNRVGLPIDSAPAVRRVPNDSIAPLSSAYQSEGSLQCVSSLAVQSENSAPIFVLDTGKICNTK